jgi:hypothetical protein
MIQRPVGVVKLLRPKSRGWKVGRPPYNRPLVPSVTTLFTGEHQQRTILETSRVDFGEELRCSATSRSQLTGAKQLAHAVQSFARC